MAIDFGIARMRTLSPGAIACAVVAAAATFLGQHYGAPVLLFALLLGMAMNFLSVDGPCAPGIEFCARSVLPGVRTFTELGYPELEALAVSGERRQLGARTDGQGNQVLQGR